MKKKYEKRSIEIRGVDSDAGTFELYACIWDSVDDYNSMFQRGCFKKSIEERVSKGLVKVMNDHGDLVGKVTEAIEDETGLLVRGKLSLGVRSADDVYIMMKDGTMNTASFGFSPIKEHRNTPGNRVITEAKLYEVSPVAFASNEETSIVDVRSTNFDETLKDNELYQRNRMIMDSLHETLWDIYWEGLTGLEAVGAIDETFGKAHAAYVEWATEVYVSTETRSMFAADNNLAQAMLDEFGGQKLEDIAAKTTMSAVEIRSLAAGKPLDMECRARLAEFSPVVSKAHSEVRAKAVEALFSEIRAGGFSQAEKSRMIALLSVGDDSENDGADELRSALDQLSNTLEGK